MRIAHFYTGIYSPGGVSTYIRDLTELQRDSGDEVFHFETQGTRPPTGLAAAGLIADQQSLFRSCLELDIDILHIHAPVLVAPPNQLGVVVTVHEHSPHCVSGGLFLKRHNKPCPRTVSLLGCANGHLIDHCGSLRPSKIVENVMRTRNQMTILPSTKVICVGHFLKSRMIKAGYRSEDITVIANFTNIEADFQDLERSEVPEFLAMGRLERLKGFDWLIKSFKHVPFPAVLNIAGAGNEMQTLRSLSKKLGIEDRVRFLGWIQGEAKLQLLKRCWALVVPSTWHETFGLVAIEAAAVGRPVIASLAGELSYIVKHNYNGKLIPVGDQKSLAEALNDIATDLAKAIRLGRNNRLEFLEKYQPGNHKDKIDEVYRAALRRRQICAEE